MSELTKAELRAHFKQVRSALTLKEKEYIDYNVFSRFVENDKFHLSQDILVYVSGDIEIGTKRIMEYVLKDAERGFKRLLCPGCEKGTNIMHFYVVKSFDDLEKGSYGILEPKSYCERVDKFVDAMCVVPALSFDSMGYRLGFGKGYYDRFLADFNGVTVGLCCESCMTDGELPRNEHDICVDQIVTEKGWGRDPKRSKERMIK